MIAPTPVLRLAAARWTGIFLALAGLPARADPVTEGLRIIGWTAAMGALELVAWGLGLGVVFLLTLLVPGALLRALVRAPLLWGFVLLMVPRYRAGPWGWRSVLFGLATAALGAWLIERRWREDEDREVDLEPD